MGVRPWSTPLEMGQMRHGKKKKSPVRVKADSKDLWLKLMVIVADGSNRWFFIGIRSLL